MWWTTGEIRRLRIERTRRCVTVISIMVPLGIAIATISFVCCWLMSDNEWVRAISTFPIVFVIITSYGIAKKLKAMRSWLAENENLVTCTDSIPSWDGGRYAGFFCIEFVPHPDGEFIGTVFEQVDAIEVDTITIEGGDDLALFGNYEENLDVVDEELVSLDEYLEDHDVDEQGR